MLLHRKLTPRYRFPDMEWSDACRDFATTFDEVEEELEKFVRLHGAVLTKEVLDDLTSATAQAASGKFDVSIHGMSQSEISVAERILDKLQMVEEKLRDAVWSQSST